MEDNMTFAVASDKLVHSVDQKDWQKVLWLIDAEGVDIETSLFGRYQGKTVLLAVVENTHISVCDVAKLIGELIRRGANINAKDNLKQTALTIACKQDRLEVVKVLIDCGATISFQDIQIVRSRSLEMIQLLITRENLELAYFCNLMTFACETRNIALMAYLKSIDMKMEEEDELVLSYALIGRQRHMIDSVAMHSNLVSASTSCHDQQQGSQWIDVPQYHQQDERLFKLCMSQLHTFTINHVQNEDPLFGAWLVVLRQVLKRGFDFIQVTTLTDVDREFLCELAFDECALISQRFEKMWHYVSLLNKVDISMYLEIDPQFRCFAVDSDDDHTEFCVPLKLCLDPKANNGTTFRLSVPSSMTVSELFSGIRVTSTAGKVQKFQLKSNDEDVVFTKFCFKTVGECFKSDVETELIVERHDMSDDELIIVEKLLRGVEEDYPGQDEEAVDEEEFAGEHYDDFPLDSDVEGAAYIDDEGFESSWHAYSVTLVY